LALSGCSALPPRDDALKTAPGDAGIAPAVSITTGAIRSGTGCRLEHSLYRPRQHSSGDLVVLGHGFLRSRKHMAGLALALAADGIPVATLDYCNMRPWDGRHVQNGLDMIALARALGAEHVVYAGFSAGALAALVAARNDPHAAGVVTLDLVDAGGIGRRAARGLGKPLIGLAGEPSNCNAEGNARRVFAHGGNTSMTRIAGAGHCDFEAPTDSLCQLLCRDPDAPAPSKRPDIIAAAKDAVHHVLASVKSEV